MLIVELGARPMIPNWQEVSGTHSPVYPAPEWEKSWMAFFPTHSNGRAMRIFEEERRRQDELGLN